MLTQDELAALRTLHGNTLEARAVRAKLEASGLRYCPRCDDVLSLDEFAPNGKYKQMNCVACVPGRRDYGRVGSRARTRERSARYRERSSAKINVDKRAAYAARRAACMTSYEASWKRPPSRDA